MKKILSGIVAIIVLLTMATSVNAAKVVADKTEVNKGEKVVVTVNMEQETDCLDVKLAYDATKFEYVTGSVATSLTNEPTVNDKTEGKIIVSASSASNKTKSISFTFVAKETTDAAEFTASGLVTASDEALTDSNVSVKVVEKAQEQPKPDDQKPAEQEKPEENNNNGTNKEENKNDKVPAKNEKVDAQGNKIKLLPQTGTSYFAIAAGVVLVMAVVVALVAKRNRK